MTRKNALLRSISLLLTLASLTLAFSACGQTADSETTGTAAPQPAASGTSLPDTTAAPEETTAEPEAPREAFTGTIEETLNALIAKAIELDEDKEFGIGSIECTPVPVDADGCERILGLTEAEFAEFVDTAIESKPNGSWFAHSVVVVKLKDGANAEELADKIVANTAPNRFGCIKAGAIVGARAGNYVVFAASSETTCEAVYKAVEALSAVSPVRIDRENTWKSTGGLIIG